MANENKRKWEKDYEKYSVMNLDDEIKKLEDEVNGLRASQAGIKDSTSKEYKEGKANQKAKEKELNKMKAIKQNMPQVKHVIDFKSKLIDKLKKLEEQKKEVEDTKKLGEEGKKLEDELAKLIERENKIKEELKNPKLTEDQKTKLQGELNKNALAQKDNHMKFSKNQLALTEKLNSPLQKKDFGKEIQATKNMISKCNFTGRNLMEGKKMQQITTDLKKWKDKKFVDKDGSTKEKKEKSENSDKPKNAEKLEKGNKPKNTEKLEKEANVEEYEKAVAEKINEEDKDLTKVSEFDQKHPRIAKVKNFFKDMGKKAKSAYVKVKDKITKRADKEDEISKSGEAKKTEEKSPKEVEGKLSSEQIADRKAEFYKRLAETGKFSKTPNSSKMKESLAEQDKIAVGREYQSKDDDSEER